MSKYSKSRVNMTAEKRRKETATCKSCKASYNNYLWLDSNNEKCYKCYGVSMEEWTNEKRVSVVQIIPETNEEILARIRKDSEEELARIDEEIQAHIKQEIEQSIVIVV